MCQNFLSTELVNTAQFYCFRFYIFFFGKFTPQGVGDYEAAFSDEEGAEGEDPAYKDFALACESNASVSEDTAAVMEEDSQGCNQRSSESSTGDSGCESASRPLSPPPTSTQYYYFYQGKMNISLLFVT